MKRDEIIKQILEAKEVGYRNRMGCNESWYDPYYAIKQTFSIEEIEQMSDREIENLIKLAQNLEEAFY